MGDYLSLRDRYHAGGREGQRGQAVIMVSMGIVFIFGILGLVVDVGWGYYLKQVVQASADAAAMAAVIDATSNGSTCGDKVLCQSDYTCPATSTNGNNFGVACLYGNANGVGGSGQTIKVSGGSGSPSSVPGLNTSNYWVTVNVSQQHNLGFLSAIGLRGGLVSARATGAVISGGGGGGCIFVMDPLMAGAFTITGTARISSDCGIHVNSSSSSALTAVGNSVTTASVVDVVGSTSINNNSTVTPRPVTGVSAADDPLAALPAPTFSGCNQTNFSASGGTVNFDPGVYCGGIKISGQAVLNFNPGTYILNGGGFTSTSNNTVINGSGVFFYNTSSGYAFGPISLAGGTQVTLTAPTDGTYQGILMFQDRNINSSATNTIAGGANPTMSGSVYMPTASVKFVGNSTTQLTLAFITNTLTVDGLAYLKADTTGALTGFNSKKPFLVQ